MGFGVEIEMIARARSMDMLTTPYAFDPGQADLLARAGADIIVAHMGLTTAGTIGAKTAKTLEQSVAEVGAIARAARAARPDIFVLCHGGPINTPDDAARVIQNTDAVGFVGASSLERMGVEESLTGLTRKFKALTVPQR